VAPQQLVSQHVAPAPHVVPGVHGAGMHAPEQNGIAWGQIVPHAPQLFGSFCVFTHAPPQHVKPPLQVIAHPASPPPLSVFPVSFDPVSLEPVSPPPESLVPVSLATESVGALSTIAPSTAESAPESPPEPSSGVAEPPQPERPNATITPSAPLQRM
jgi:hypothetical protein